jgi:hypothetical protein
MSAPKQTHCEIGPACSVSETDAPPPPGIDPKAWAEIGATAMCTCSCPICRPPKRRRKAHPQKGKASRRN